VPPMVKKTNIYKAVQEIPEPDSVPDPSIPRTVQPGPTYTSTSSSSPSSQTSSGGMPPGAQFIPVVQQVEASGLRDEPVVIGTVSSSEPVVDTSDIDIRYSRSALRTETEMGMEARWKAYEDVDVDKDYFVDTGMPRGAYFFPFVQASKEKTYVVSGEELKQIRKEELEEYNKYWTWAHKLKPYEYVWKKPTGWEIETDVVAKAKSEWDEAGKPLNIWDIGLKKITGLSARQTTKAAFVTFTHWPETIFRAPIIKDIPLIGAGKGYDTYGKELAAWESYEWGKAKEYSKFYGAVLSGDKEQAKKSWEAGKDFQMNIATSPAMILMYTLSAQVVLSPVVKASTKYIVKNIPKVYSAYVKTFPQGSGVRLESGELIGQSYFRRQVSKIPYTQFAQNIYGWSTGTMSRVRYLPLKKTIVTKGVGQVEIYKGWGKPRWVATSTLEQYKTSEIFSHQYIKSTIGTGREQIYSKTVVGKPSGSLWWKKLKVQKFGFYEFEPMIYKVEKKGIADIWSGWKRIKPDTPMTGFRITTSKSVSMPNIWKDTRGYTTLTHQMQGRPMVTGRIKSYGSLSNRSFIMPSVTNAKMFIPVIPSLIPVTSSRLEPVSIQTRMPQYDVVTKSKPKMVDERMSIMLEQAKTQIPVTESDQMQISLLQPEQLFKQKQEQQQIYAFAQEQIYDVKTQMAPMIGLPKPVSVVTSPARIMFPSLDGSSKKTKKRPGFEPGYHVMVKDRMYVSGKKKHSERFFKLNKRPLSRSDAMSLGGSAVNESAAATFYIKPANKKAVSPRVPVTSWNMLSDMFYKRNDRFIERTSFRINTPGEIREISARGWYADRKKLYPVSKKAKRMSVVNRKGLKNMNNMERVLGRYGFG